MDCERLESRSRVTDTTSLLQLVPNYCFQELRKAMKKKRERKENRVVDELEDDGRDKKRGRKSKFMPTALWAFKFLSKLRIVPMQWDPESVSFRSGPRFSSRMLHYYLGIACLWLEYGFLSVRFVQLIRKNWPINQDSVTLGQVIALFSFMAAKSMAAFTHLIFVLQPKGLSYLTNELIRSRRAAHLMKDLPAVKVFLGLFIFRSLQMFLVSYGRPNKFQFWWSILSPRWKTKTMFVLHLIFNGFTASMFVSIQYLLIVMLCYTHYLQICLRRRFSRFTSIYYKILDYRRLQILAICFQKTCGVIAVPYITTYAFVMTVVLTFASCRYYDTLDLRVYMQMPLGLLMISSFAVAFYSSVGAQPHLSKKALKIRFEDPVGTGFRKVENKIYFKACKTISLFKIKRTFLPSLARFVVFQTTRLLIFTSNR